MKNLLSVGAFALSMCVAQSALAERTCGPREEAVKVLSEVYGEQVIASFPADNRFVEMWSGPNSSTVVVTDLTSRTSCLILAGQGATLTPPSSVEGDPA